MLDPVHVGARCACTFLTLTRGRFLMTLSGASNNVGVEEVRIRVASRASAVQRNESGFVLEWGGKRKQANTAAVLH